MSTPVCFHCGSAVLSHDAPHLVVDGRVQPLCCAGCDAAARFILAQGLERFYQYRAPSPPADAVERDWRVYDRPTQLRRYTQLRADGLREVAIHLEGMHCAACVWLIENSLRRVPGTSDICVNLAETRAQLRFDPQQLLLSDLLRTLHQLGYRPRPVNLGDDVRQSDEARRGALRRLAVAGFGMMQVMTFAVCLYAGAMDGIAPDLEQLLRLVSLVVSTPVVLYAAQPFFVSAYRSVRAGTLGMDVPVALSIGAAYVWSVWATFVGHGTLYFDSAVMFTFLLLLGRYVEMSLRHRAGRQQDSLDRLLPASALRVCGATSERVAPEELECGDHIRVLPGERIPADGQVDSGASEIDESLLNGESLPRVCRRGDTVLAGTRNLTGALDLIVTRVGQDSTLVAIGRLLLRAHAARPPVAVLADRVASWFVGAILVLALVVGALWWHADSGRAFAAVLAVLVVTCPCALSLATPAALSAATASLARSGVLVVRSAALERLARVDHIVFDKTGTLTRGQPRIVSTTTFEPRTSAESCRGIAAVLEGYSPHPIAQAFRAAGKGTAEEVRVVPSGGIEGRIDGQLYRIGHADFVRSGAATARWQALPDVSASGAHMVVWLADAQGPLAQFTLTDELRHDAAESISRLRALGLAAQIASGDRPDPVQLCARRLGIDHAESRLNASDKLNLVEQMHAQGHRLVMVGDGINDAPVLAAADVSVAVGTGTELARTSADLILLGSGLGGLVVAVTTARRMLAVIRQNLTWAALYNITAVPLAAAGLLDPWMAALGMSASSLLVVANALRLMRAPRPTAETPGPLASQELHS
jgi:Cu2+-exporting ATPase